MNYARCLVPTRLSSQRQKTRIEVHAKEAMPQEVGLVGFCEMAIVAPVIYARHESITLRFGWPAGLSSHETGNSGGQDGIRPPTPGKLQDT